VHSYFAADMLITKLRKLVQDMRALGAQVVADDIETRLKTSRDQALRGVRDQRELVSEGGNNLRLGQPRFHHQPASTGADPGAQWRRPGLPPDRHGLSGARQRHGAGRLQTLLAASSAVRDRRHQPRRIPGGLPAGRHTTSHHAPAWARITELIALGPDGHAALLDHVRQFAAERYQDGYEKGVHDEDATRIFSALAAMQDAAGLLAWGPTERALALLYWQDGRFGAERESLHRRARSALQVQQLFGARDSLVFLEQELPKRWPCLPRLWGLNYRFKPMGPMRLNAWPPCAPSRGLLGARSGQREWRGVMGHQRCRRRPGSTPAARAGAWWPMARMATQPGGIRTGRALGAGTQLGQGLCQHARRCHQFAWVDDAASLLAVPVQRRRVNASLDTTVEGLRGEHTRVDNGRMALNLNDFWRRFAFHRDRVVPGFQALQKLHHSLLSAEKNRLSLAQFQAKPLPPLCATA
jgi:hypothetical protein